MTIFSRAVMAAVPVCALALTGTASAGIMLGENLLNNHDAEAGPGGSGQVVPVPGWSVTEGLFTVAAYGSPGLLQAGDPGPPDRGNNYFMGGSAETSVAEQRYNLFSLAAQIDSGDLAVELSGWLGTTVGQPGDATLSVTFLDAAMMSLGTVTLGNIRGDGPAGGLFYFETDGVIPVGTREAVVELSLFRGSSSALNHGSADELSFTIVPGPSGAAVLVLGGLAATGRRRR